MGAFKEYMLGIDPGFAHVLNPDSAFHWRDFDNEPYFKVYPHSGQIIFNCGKLMERGKSGETRMFELRHKLKRLKDYPVIFVEEYNNDYSNFALRIYVVKDAEYLDAGYVPNPSYLEEKSLTFVQWFRDNLSKFRQPTLYYDSFLGMFVIICGLDWDYIDEKETLLEPLLPNKTDKKSVSSKNKNKKQKSNRKKFIIFWSICLLFFLIIFWQFFAVLIASFLIYKVYGWIKKSFFHHKTKGGKLWARGKTN